MRRLVIWLIRLITVVFADEAKPTSSESAKLTDGDKGKPAEAAPPSTTPTAGKSRSKREEEEEEERRYKECSSDSDLVYNKG